MKAKDFVCRSLAAGTLAIFTGCGGGGSGGSMSMTSAAPPASTAPMPMTQNLEFPQIRDMANGASETTDPLGVNGGAVTVTPTDDDVSDPGSVR